jgi:hypothetical protein
MDFGRSPVSDRDERITPNIAADRAERHLDSDVNFGGNITPRKKLKRIVTCQGGIQLIAAMAALNSRESERKDSGDKFEYEDFLVIYDLYAPYGQLEEFACFIKKMAITVCHWQAVVYINQKQIDDFASTLNILATPNVFTRVHELVGIDNVDEIYLCRNWQFGNRLMLNAYREAEKICYGDSIGIYFSEAYFTPPDSKISAGRTGFSIRNRLRALRNRMRAAVTHRSALKEVEFDVGYFLLPDILGESPPMKTLTLDKEYTLQLFRKLSGLLEEGRVSQVRARVSGRPAVIMLTSSFSEAGRMSFENEIAAYVKFLSALDHLTESVLIIKPHPRDSPSKIKELESAVGDLFSEVILLDETDLFFLPFEIFLMSAFTDINAEVTQCIKIVTFSTACLSFPFLFNLKPIVGFGSELVNEYFDERFAPGRDAHERDLRLAIQRISEGAGL